VKNKTIVSYSITNYSPLPVDLERILLGNDLLYNQSMTLCPLQTWNKNFTLTKLNSSIVSSFIKNQANYTAELNFSIISLSGFSF